MAYHPQENYLYAVAQGNTVGASVVRIGQGGSFVALPNSTIPQFSSTTYMTSGDIDNNGTYWIAYNGGNKWVQFDLVNSSSTYGQVINNGSGSNIGLFVVSDWAYLPAYPNKLYTFGGQTVNSTAGLYNTGLLSFDLTTKSWTALATYYNVSGSTSCSAGKAQWGAVYSTSDGYLYATENNSGGIFRTKLTTPISTEFTNSTSPVPQAIGGQSNDGARCMYGPNTITAKRGADPNMGFDMPRNENSDTQEISRRNGREEQSYWLGRVMCGRRGAEQV